ncbi:hypothetical protein B484DRAFT_432519 [Ochromonadaceae sp. CCMP2298]|nr:hypothetical protein B484DRAFT_432519 [Ochromonadaceae sp. CCMP2298]
MFRTATRDFGEETLGQYSMTQGPRKEESHSYYARSKSFDFTLNTYEMRSPRMGSPYGSDGGGSGSYHHHYQDEYSTHPFGESKHSSMGFAHHQSKCRQLPCRTFISTGSCPYGERCVFLHDPSVVSKPVYIRCKRKSKDDTVVDAFFWPTMPWSAVVREPENRNVPLITQPYIVPAPNSCSFSTSNNDQAVYSMWETFMDFCKSDILSVVTVPRATPPQVHDPRTRNNVYTGKPRLPVLVRLSQQ